MGCVQIVCGVLLQNVRVYGGVLSSIPKFGNVSMSSYCAARASQFVVGYSPLLAHSRHRTCRNYRRTVLVGTPAITSSTNFESFPSQPLQSTQTISPRVMQKENGFSLADFLEKARPCAVEKALPSTDLDDIVPNDIQLLVARVLVAR